MGKKVFKDLEFRVFRSRNINAAQVIILHGICEHSFRYLPLIHRLNDAGIDCTLIDHPGHGVQISPYLSCEKSYNSYLNGNQMPTDKYFQKEFYRANKNLTLSKIISFQEEFIKFLFSEKIFNPDRPTFLLGQSMGGLIAAVLAEKIHSLTGIILLSPAFKARAKLITNNSAGDKVRFKVESTIIRKSDESFQKSSLFKTFILSPLLAINPPNECSWAKDYISDLKEVNCTFANDPYVGRKLSLRFLQTIQSQMYHTREKKSTFPYPVFMEFGSEDKIVDAEGSEIFSQKRLGHKNDHVRKIENFQPHEIHNSSMKDELFRNMTDWIAKLSQTPAV